MTAASIQWNLNIAKLTGTCNKFIILGISLYQVIWKLVEVTVRI